MSWETITGGICHFSADRYGRFCPRLRFVLFRMHVVVVSYTHAEKVITG